LALLLFSGYVLRHDGWNVERGLVLPFQACFGCLLHSPEALAFQVCMAVRHHESFRQALLKVGAFRRRTAGLAALQCFKELLQRLPREAGV
jgi:hypothetical protein